MNENNKTNLSLEALFLNDLLNTKVIDNNIYSMALSKLKEKQKDVCLIEKPVILATA